MSRWTEISEKAFQAQVTGLAQLLGWHTLHVSHSPQVNRERNVVTRYTTPTTGTLGRGWPDLVLVHERAKRIIFAELKSETGKVSPDQERVLSVLRSLVAQTHPRTETEPARSIVRFDGVLVDVYVWRPSDIEVIERVLTWPPR